MSIEVMRQALEALESENPDIQLRAAISLRQAIKDAQESDELTLVYMDGKIAGWNAALDEAAARIANVRGFGQATQDSFAAYIRELKK